MFIAYLRKIDLAGKIREYMPVRWRSPNQIDPTTTFISFLMAVLVGTKRFAHANWLRGDRALHAMLGLDRFPCGDTIRNLFRQFSLLSFLEQRCLPYIVVTRLTKWVKREAQRIPHWGELDANYAVGEFRLTLHGWTTQRRFVVIRERVRESRASVGRKLIEVPGYTFRIFVTSLDGPPEEIWRDYNRRADIENRIAELKHDLNAHHFCLKQFHATEAAFRSVLLLFNLLAEFQRAAGMPGYREPATIRTQVLTCGAILGRSARRLVVHLGESWGGLKTRKPLLASILEWEIPTSPKLIQAVRC